MVPLEPNLFVPRAADYVREAIKTVGYARNTTGYAPHEFLVRDDSLKFRIGRSTC